MAMGGTGTPSLNHPALTRAAFLCQLTTFRKCSAWRGLVRLTLTNSEKKIRRLRLRVAALLLLLSIYCSLGKFSWRITSPMHKLK